MSRKKSALMVFVSLLVVFAGILIFLSMNGCSKAMPTAVLPENPGTVHDTVYVEQPEIPVDLTVTFEPLGPYSIESDGSVMVIANVKKSGTYRIFAKVSYTALVNESFFLEIQGGDGIVRNDQYPNAGSSRVVLDDPSFSGTTTEVVAGIFWMPKGLAKIKIRHFSQIAAKYPLLIQGSGYNTVHISDLRCEYLGQ